MGGSDNSSNLVRLTGREHFVAHWLLHRAYPKNDSLAHAFFAMATLNKGSGFTPSSRAYEEARQAHSIIMSERMAGRVVKQETKDKIKESKAGITYENRKHWGKDNHNHGRFWIKNRSTGHEMMISSDKTIPDGYERGRLDKFGNSRFVASGYSWYNNGIIERLFILNEQEYGFKKGRLPFQGQKKRKTV